MDIAKAIKHIYPHVEFGSFGNVLLVEEGNGVEIKEWNISEPIPTQEELEAAYREALRYEELEETWRKRARAFSESALNELEWIEQTKPQIDSMNGAQLAQVLKRVMAENEHIIKALNFLVRQTFNIKFDQQEGFYGIVESNLGIREG